MLTSIFDLIFASSLTFTTLIPAEGAAPSDAMRVGQNGQNFKKKFKRPNKMSVVQGIF